MGISKTGTGKLQRGTKMKFYTVGFTYDAEATPREENFRTVKATDEADAKDQVKIWAILNGDRINVAATMTNS